MFGIYSRHLINHTMRCVTAYQVGNPPLTNTVRGIDGTSLFRGPILFAQPLPVMLPHRFYASKPSFESTEPCNVSRFSYLPPQNLKLFQNQVEEELSKMTMTLVSYHFFTKILERTVGGSFTLSADFKNPFSNLEHIIIADYRNQIESGKLTTDVFSRDILDVFVRNVLRSSLFRENPEIYVKTWIKSEKIFIRIFNERTRPLQQFFVDKLEIDVQ